MGIESLRSAGRITESLRDEYMEASDGDIARVNASPIATCLNGWMTTPRAIGRTGPQRSVSCLISRFATWRSTTELAAYRGGRLTLRELATMLGLDVWATHDLLSAEGVAVAQGTMAETAADANALLAEMLALQPDPPPLR